MSTRRDGSATPGGGWNRSALATVKTVVLAPIPMASDSTAVIVTTGFLRSRRPACTRSRRTSVADKKRRWLNGIALAPHTEREDRPRERKDGSARERDPARMTWFEPIRERSESRVNSASEPAEQQPEHQPPDPQQDTD